MGAGPLEVADRDAVGQICAAPVLAVPPALQGQIAEMIALHDTRLNRHYAPDPSLWRQPECVAFNQMADACLAALRRAFAAGFDIVDAQPRYGEDPELDRYLQDPLGFRRGGSEPSA